MINYSPNGVLRNNLSVIRQKGQSHNGYYKKKSTSNFPENKHILPPDTHTNVCISRGKKYSLFGKFGVLCFLVTSVLRFALLNYYRQSTLKNFPKFQKQLP